MTYFVFDLETSGLPDTLGWMRYHSPYQTDKYQTSKIIEVAYIILDESFTPVCKKSMIVYPSFEICNDHIHGITTEMAKKEGGNESDVFKQIYDDLLTHKCKYIVSHNIKFDYNVLLSNLIFNSRFRNFVILLKSLEKKCTMKMGKEHFELNRYPKLVDLYQLVSKKEWVQSHRALDDAEKCSICFTGMNNKEPICV